MDAAVFIPLQEHQRYARKSTLVNGTCYSTRVLSGNPFDLKWTLSTLVRDGDIYYDYVAQEWNIRTAVLNAYPDLSAEDFAARYVVAVSLLSYASPPNFCDSQCPE